MLLFNKGQCVADFTRMPRSLHINGRIERSQGIDKDHCKRLTGNSHDKVRLQAFPVEGCLDYNFYRPRNIIHKLTPAEYLQSLPDFAHVTLDTSVLLA